MRRDLKTLSNPEIVALASVVGETDLDIARKSVGSRIPKKEGGETQDLKGKLRLEIDYEYKVDPDTTVRARLNWRSVCVLLLQELHRRGVSLGDLGKIVTKALKETCRDNPRIPKRAEKALRIAEAEACQTYAGKKTYPRRGAVRAVSVQVKRMPAEVTLVNPLTMRRTLDNSMLDMVEEEHETLLRDEDYESREV